MTQEVIIADYIRIREVLGHQPSSKEFYDNSTYKKRALNKAFGINAYSKLTEKCGDKPKIFLNPKSNLNNIFDQYGKLVRNLNRLPRSFEWDQSELRPSVAGIEKSHKFRWGQMAEKFLEYSQNLNEWNDVKSIIYKSIESINRVISDNSNAEGCFVYLMHDKKTNLYKIGISKTAEYREKTLQSEQPSVVLVAKKMYINRRMAGNLEKALHESYSHKRKRGEWFILDSMDVFEIKATLDDKI